MKTKDFGTSEQLFERAKKLAPGGVHSPVRAFRSVGGTPVYFASAEGAKLKSVDGKTYIDFCQAFGPMLLGHRDPEVTASVKAMLDTAWSFGACEPYSVELAEWIIHEVPCVEKLRFVNSGTEAVMSALRVARAATKRTKILKFDGCYHGHVDSMLVKAGSGLAGAVASDSAGVADAQETLIAPLNDLIALEKVFSSYPNEIAAVIIEPMPANYGLLLQTKEFLEGVASLAKKYGALLIFDEVISGFRVRMGGMAEYTGMSPDLVTYGKVAGGGLPFGCFGGKKELLDLVAPQGPVYQAGTMSANPVSISAGLSTLEKVKRMGLHEALEARTRKFADEFRSRLKGLKSSFTVTDFASLFWIHADVGTPIRTLSQIPPSHREKFPAFFHAALDRGIYLPPSAFEVCFISAAHTDEILKEALEKLEAAAKDAKL